MELHAMHIAVLTRLIIATMLATARDTKVLRGCNDSCGAVAIPYPFGIGDGCYLEEKFNITCNISDVANPKAYRGNGNVPITNIFVDSGEFQLMDNKRKRIARDCYNTSGSPDKNRSNDATLTFSRSGFTISSTKNKFFVIGCDTYGIIQGYNLARKRFVTGCISLCDDKASVSSKSCSGVGCCEAAIPEGLHNHTVTLNSFDNHTYIWNFNPCSYAFIVEEGQFNFSGISSFRRLDKVYKLPMIVDWSVGNQSCEQAKAAGNVTYCKGNSTCENSRTGIGYLCKCLPGYEGNPYHPDGCHDIDECKMKNRCNGTCINTPGSYNCICSKGFTLTKDRTMCIKNNKNDRALILYIPLGISIGILGLICLVLMLCLGHRKRKLIKQKEKYFEQNGGLMIQQRLSSIERGKLFDTKIFSEEELIRATNNYQELVGEGGYGVVYKGTLPDNKVVAVKKSKIEAKKQTERQTEEFINEVILLMQINHKNVVRLLGCCLDTKVPILVYEFITNGTLYERIHKKVSEDRALSWEQRLKIATETAEALAYLHFEINTPIFHRDIKSMNILLDENYTAKVSDFRASRLVSLDENELSTLVQGTVGYLDPEYLQSSKLTEKSDVYSFGVVLAELITGKKAISFDKSEGTTRNLAMSFLSLGEDTELCRAIDEDIFDDEKMKEIKEVVNLAKRCLRIIGDERPTMKEVAMELQGLIRATSNHPWVEDVEPFNKEEIELLGSPSIEMNHSNNLDCGSSNTTFVYDNQSFNNGR